MRCVSYRPVAIFVRQRASLSIILNFELHTSRGTDIARIASRIALNEMATEIIDVNEIRKRDSGIRIIITLEIDRSSPTAEYPKDG